VSRPVVTAQRKLSFETDRKGRTEAELRHALTKALRVVAGDGEAESAVRESFVHAAAGLGCDKAVLVQVRAEQPLDIEVLHSIGLTPDDESALVGLRPSPRINAALISRAVAEARCQVLGGPEAADAPAVDSHDRPYSGLCSPLTDTLSGAIVAVAYFQNPVDSAFATEDVDWVSAYGVALGQALTLQLSKARSTEEPRSEPRAAGDRPRVEIIGNSVASQQLAAKLKLLLPSTRRIDPPPILITGESGTGKEVVASYLHRCSPRRANPFVTFNCAGLRGELAQSVLFGHVKGSFTGALTDTPGLFRAAHKGVLFLDEVGEMPLEGQALLLRVLETRMVQPVGDTKETPVDVQIVAATNRNLQEEISARRFREDLYFRLSALQVELAPLRDPSRLADLRPLVAHYVAIHERGLNKKTAGFTPAAFRALLRYAWPGNVRQLNQVCMSLVTYAEPGAAIDVADIQQHWPELLRGPRNPYPEAILEDRTARHEEAMDAFQNRLVLDRLEQCGGKASAAALSLGISEPTFYRYLAQARKSV